MWEPVGPLPASVYWRRRWLAVASSVAVLALVAWSAAAIAAPRDPAAADDASTRAASRAAVAADQASPEISPTPTGAGPQDVVGPLRSDVTAPAPELLAPAPTPAAPAEQAPTGPPPPAEAAPGGQPQPCADPVLAVAAEVERPEHRIGETAVLRLVVTNVGDRPCLRDLDPARQEVVVWSGDGAVRLWSSNDCATASSADVRTLEPGLAVEFTVRWGGATSAPGCSGPREQVPVGAYRVLTRVDEVISAPTPFLRSA